MPRLRLRVELLVSTLLVICLLLGAILIVVRQMIRSEISGQLQRSTSDSLQAFDTFQKQHAIELSRTASLLAELPTLKALMTTNDPATVQDASEPFSELAGSDLFVLANPQRKVLAFHSSTTGWTPDIAEHDLSRSLEQMQEPTWWFANRQLYLVFVRPMTVGASADRKQLGILAVGFRVSSEFASQLGLVTGNEIALSADNQLIASTLAPGDEARLASWITGQSGRIGLPAQELQLVSDKYEVASESLGASDRIAIACYVLKPMAEASQLIMRVNRIILILGISAVLLAAALLSIISKTITRPLDNLVAGVRALAVGDYGYLITARGSSEVAELAKAFSKMRSELYQSHQRQIANERITALGRAASSISHDLRHYLAAVVANAEFLYEADRLKLSKDEIYAEIKSGSDQMIDLLDSLRELARETKTISPVTAAMDQTIRRALDAVLALPEFRTHSVSIQKQGGMEGTFDPKKIERVFFNLILNACQATGEQPSAIDIEISSSAEWFAIRVHDNGCGVPPAIQNTLFHPFVSVGKANSTGLGLAIVKKIIDDHGGSIVVEKTSDAGTVFLLKLPRAASAVSQEYQEDVASPKSTGTGH